MGYITFRSIDYEWCPAYSFTNFLIPERSTLKLIERLVPTLKKGAIAREPDTLS